MAPHIREEAGIGLVELLVAMVVMSIGIMALVAGFSSGQKAVVRAHNASSAASVADAKMESYRALAYDAIALTPGCFASAGCAPTVTPETAGDGRTYSMEVSIGYDCPVGTLGPSPPASCTSPNSQPTKRVKIVMKNADGTKTLFTQSSTFAKKATG